MTKEELVEYLLYRISIPPERRKGMGYCILCGSRRYKHTCRPKKTEKGVKCPTLSYAGYRFHDGAGR